MAGLERRILRVAGDEARDFVQGLVSNDVPSEDCSLRYAALLTPQGKYLCDFFMFMRAGEVHLDAPAGLFDDLLRRLTMYRLRRKIVLQEAALSVSRGTGPAPDGAMGDPRHPEMGWRAYGDRPGADDATDWDALRVAHCIPEAGVELIPGESYLLEMGFERLNGIDFRKGCYVGQEINARMKHKTELRKGLATVAIEGTAPPGTPILRDARTVGTLFTQAGDRAIAYLRFERAGADMKAGDARVAWSPEVQARSE